MLTRTFKTAVHWLALAALLLGLPVAVQALEPLDVSGNIAVEERFFLRTGDAPTRDRYGISASAELEMFQPLGAHSVTLTPFGRVDSEDSERTHWDLREAFVQLVSDRWELDLGARRVFWGVTESQHLVDIINQTDQVEAIDGEDKLGQPMAHLSRLADWGTLELFVMPYFRQRTFPGEDGRLRAPLVVSNTASYQSGHGAHHLDLAARYSHYIGQWDVALSHFSGTSREAQFNLNGTGLTPHYPLIEQTGMEVQRVASEWLLKGEAIHRTGFGDGYYAWVTGFEYTFVGLFGSVMDLGVLGEWHRDTRGRDASSPFNHDLMAGLRLAVNDMQSTEALLGVVADPVIGGHSLFIEAGRRIGSAYKLELEARFFGGPPEDIAYALRNDDLVQASLAYYF